MDDRDFKNLSRTSMESDKNILGQFLRHCNEHEVVDVKDITPNVVKNFWLSIRRRGIVRSHQYIS